MRILLLSQFFWPEVRTAPTNLAAMAQDLQEKGHEVLVITGYPNHPFGRIYEGYKIKMWQWDVVNGVRTLRLVLIPDHSLSLLRRLLNYGSFAISLGSLGLFFSRNFKPDIIFTYYAPLTIGIPAFLFKTLHHVPLVYWVTDLWSENIKVANSIVGRRSYSILCKLESLGYSLANFIFVDSPGFKENLLDKKVDGNKIEVFSEWADEDLFFPVEPDKELADKFGLDGKFNIVYGGNIGTVQNLETVIQTAKLVQDLSDLQFVLIGDGNDLENLRRQVDELNVQNVLFIPRQSPREIHRFFALADALVVHLKREPVFELQLPSKVLAYLACGRPILCAVPGTVADVVRDAQAGVFCPSEDPTAMAKQVRHLYALPKNEREAMGKRARQNYLEKYTRTIQVERIEQELEKILDSRIN